MSLKPPKKSDMRKKWMKPRRDRNILICPEYHLIVTEGTETEPQYFASIRDIINRQYRDKIQLDIYGEGDNTLSLLDKAVNRVRNNPNGYKHVLIVYDTDDFPADHINKTGERCAKLSTDETLYHAVWSNQCIELWFLLHFEFLQSDLHRKEYWLKLSDKFRSIRQGEYSKGRPDMFQILLPFMGSAIANAERLAVQNKGKTPAASAPGTKMHELIKHLRPYLNRQNNQHQNANS